MRRTAPGASGESRPGLSASESSEYSNCLSCQNFDSADLGEIGRASSELDSDGSGAACGDGEGFGDSDIFSARGGKNIEVRQHRRVVDQDVEFPFSGGGPVNFRKVESYSVVSAGRQIGNGVGKVLEALGLIDRLRSRKTLYEASEFVLAVQLRVA
jgi:hypothetical protein